MIYLLDTNACIAWLRQNQPRLIARIQNEDPNNLAICSVVLSELIYGAERSGMAHRAANLQRVEQLRQRFQSLPFDDRAGIEAGRIRAHLAAAGTPIGPYDLQIASIARANGLIVVTHNTAEFGRVPGLQVEDWELP